MYLLVQYLETSGSLWSPQIKLALNAILSKSYKEFLGLITISMRTRTRTATTFIVILILHGGIVRRKLLDLGDNMKRRAHESGSNASLDGSNASGLWCHCLVPTVMVKPYATLGLY